MQFELHIYLVPDYIQLIIEYIDMSFYEIYRGEKSTENIFSKFEMNIFLIFCREMLISQQILHNIKTLINVSRISSKYIHECFKIVKVEQRHT